MENTPAVTGITKQVAATEYDSEKDLETGYTWAGSASFTGLAPHIESVTALFKVTVTGTSERLQRQADRCSRYGEGCHAGEPG